MSTLVRQGRITGPDGAWAAIAARVAAVPEYAQRFQAVYPEIAAGRGIDFTDISNAIAAYMTFDFRSDSAPFDLWLQGKGDLGPQELAGMEAFFGKGGCAACHSGSLFSDMGFHAMGDPQIGPGKAERFERHQRDTGRMKVSNNPADAYAFRTPSLRNVTLTGPYGHAGAYGDLAAYLASTSRRVRPLKPIQRKAPSCLRWIWESRISPRSGRVQLSGHCPGGQRPGCGVEPGRSGQYPCLPEISGRPGRRAWRANGHPRKRAVGPAG